MFFSLNSNTQTKPLIDKSDRGYSKVRNSIFASYMELTRKMAEKLKDFIPPSPEEKTAQTTFREATLDAKSDITEEVEKPELPPTREKLPPIPVESAAPKVEQPSDSSPSQKIITLNSKSQQDSSVAQPCTETIQIPDSMKRWEKISLVVFLTSLIGFVSGAALAIVILNGDLDINKDDIKNVLKIFQTSSS